MPGEDALRFAFKAGAQYAKNNKEDLYDEAAIEKGFKNWFHLWHRLDGALQPKDVIRQAAKLRKLQKVKGMDEITRHLAVSGDLYDEQCEAELWLAIFKEVGVIKGPPEG